MAGVAGQAFSMDAASQQAFCRFFRGLPETTSTTIRFFERADQYILLGNDAVFAAQQVFNTLSACKTIGADPNKLKSLSLNKARYEAFVRDLLLVKQYRVEMYARKTNRLNDWEIAYSGSPGNLSQFEDILFNNDFAVNVHVVAVKLDSDGKNKIVGLSCLDVLSTLISVCEIKDDDSFINLESLIVNLAPKECLLSLGDPSGDTKILKQIMERNNILVTMRKKTEFSTDSLMDDLTLLIKFAKGQQKSANVLPETQIASAMPATAALLKYLNLTSEEGNLGQFSMQHIEQTRFVRMNAGAIQALNLEHRNDGSSGHQHEGAPTSIFDLLDKCRTPQGHRLLAEWIRQPLRDIALIKERHDVVEAMCDDSALRTCLIEDYLRRVPDLQHISKKLAREKATLQDCYKIYLCIDHLPSMLERLSQAPNQVTIKAMFIEPLQCLLQEMDRFQQMVDQTIDLEAAGMGEFRVNPEFKEELKELKETMDELERDMKNQLSKAANDLDLEENKSLKLESNNQYGFYFRVTLKGEKGLRDKKKYTVLDSNSGGVKFRTSKLEESNSAYMAARESYEVEQKSNVVEIIKIAAGYSSTIKSIGNIISTLDVLTGFAVAALNATPYKRPKMLPSDAGEMSLVAARHPCLELLQGNATFIPNDLKLKRNEVDFCIITGPNMGGKSTYIRTAGVVALMAHIGSFVPCEEATISVLDSILARIGADDAETKGMSTFMVEMVETSTILKATSCNSLVIIDELGRGTSTYDGCGLAWSFAEYLATKIHPFCLFATHFHEIAKLEDQVPNVKNFHVTALIGQEKLTLLYEVRPGVCDQSFGIHVAKMANFPKSAIEFATKKQNELEGLQGMNLIVCDNPKKKQKLFQEGKELIDQCMGKIEALRDNPSAEEREKETKRLIEELLSRDNFDAKALMENL